MMKFIKWISKVGKLVKENNDKELLAEAKKDRDVECIQNFIFSVAGCFVFFLGMIFDIMEGCGHDLKLIGVPLGLVFLVLFGIILILFSYNCKEILLNKSNNRHLNSLLCTYTGIAAILFGCEKMMIIEDDFLCVEIIFLAGSIVVGIGYLIGHVLRKEQATQLCDDEAIQK